MNKQQQVCSLCLVPFVTSSQPRIMPNCSHNACTSCLKTFIKRSHESQIALHCKHCDSSQIILQPDLQFFPKNISLIKSLKDQKINPEKNSPGQTYQIQVKEHSVDFNKDDYCEMHKKQKQMICINESIRLCPHCAIFGNHKQHKIITVSEAKKIIFDKSNNFLLFKNKKLELDSKISSKQFKQSLLNKMNGKKDQLMMKIKKKFKNLYQNIKLAQKNAYDDLIKNYKTIASKISDFLKEQNDVLRRYKNWQQKCEKLLQECQKIDKIQLKTNLFLNGPLQIDKQGQSLLKRLEQKYDGKVKNIDEIISQLNLVEDKTVGNSLFNYVNIVIQENSNQFQGIGYVPHQIIFTPQHKKKDESKVVVEFSSVNLIKEKQKSKSISPIRKNLSFRKSSQKLDDSMLYDKSFSSQLSLSEKNNVQSLIEQFSHRQNFDTLDLSGYLLADNQIYEILNYLRPIKKIKGLKLVKNRLTTQGFMKIIQLIPSVTNLNISFNSLDDESVEVILRYRQKLPVLRIVNLSNNKINERKAKATIDQLKRQGLIVTI